MKYPSRLLLIAVCAVATAGSSPGSLTAHEPETTISAGSQALHKAMEKGHKEMMAMNTTGDADHDFAMTMVSHHKGAIEMSEIILKHGKDPKVAAMARRIIEAQKKEIAEFEAWMKTHKPSTAGHAH